MNPDNPDFYEEDEPVEDLEAAWEAGTKLVTVNPADLESPEYGTQGMTAEEWEAITDDFRGSGG